MDPFSVTVGVVSLLDVCTRTVSFLKNVSNSVSTVDQDVEAVKNDVEAVQSAVAALKDVYNTWVSYDSGNVVPGTGGASQVWENLIRLLPRCEQTILKLQRLIEGIGDFRLPKSASRFESLVKSLRKQARESEYLLLRRELGSYITTLQMLLSAIQASSTWTTRSSTPDSSASTRSFHLLDRKIESFRPLLEHGLGAGLRSAFEAATEVALLASKNKYFDIPQAASSIFTGREDLLDELANLMFPPAKEPDISHVSQSQKRFVLYGLGGSGKTQFCCKFAEDFRQRYWGVFWVDGSSEEYLKQTFSHIAKTAGLEPNDRAARSLLSSLMEPWLLIIDNLNDDRVEIENFFPRGEKGQILITTRNPFHKIHGTVGRGFFDFSNWNTDAATKLLLKAANQALPWTPPIITAASRISNALGLLPLALVVAGRTVLKGLCTLKEYLSFYQNHWKRVRERARSKSLTKASKVKDDSPLSIYTSCEVMHVNLESEGSQAAVDAIELLNIFSFLHRENITLKLLVQGATNPIREKQEAESQKSLELSKGKWRRRLETLKLAVVDFLLADTEKPILPEILRLQHSDADSFDEVRLREALVALSQRSLIMYNPTKDSYSMHPIVHTWVRERPEMMTANQAIWCEASAALLSQCILLPPLAMTEKDEDFRRDLLPHVKHMRRCREEITCQFAQNQRKRTHLWPLLKPSMSRRQVLASAKYSIVYAQCGLWEEAEKLQLVVYDFLCTNLGLKHQNTVRIQLALAETQWQLGRGNDAANLQEDALISSISSLGIKHLMTLKVMDSLGVSRWMQGRHKEALKLHETTIKLLSETVGSEHADTLRAKDHLGRVHFKYFEYEKARQLHHTATTGLERCLGPTHSDTMAAMENLAMTYLEVGQDLLPLARPLMEQVAKRRQEKFGKEHPYTLLALLNLARIKAAEGSLDEAKANINSGLLIAYRNLGANHIGVLYARMYLGDILFKLGCVQEAIEELSDVLERQKNMSASQSGVHPDCLMSTYLLADCFGAQNRYGEAIALCNEAICGLEKLGGHDHPLNSKLRERQQSMTRQLAGAAVVGSHALLHH